MPNISKQYKFEYFPRGEEYSARSDYQRFITLDYNMQSYIGITGVGVINGWSLEEVNGITIQILPGFGIINGYFAESPYEIKQRSAMISGDRETEVIQYSQIPEPDLTDAQADAYVAVVQEYNPTFNPTRPIENAYVKVVIPTEIILSNNADTYIWVTRKFSNFYPPLADYPPYTITEPNVGDYSSYGDYLAVKTTYDIQMDAIYSYNWQDSPNNHFTEVNFNSGSTFITGSTKVLLGKVVTRNGAVTKIDTSQVNSLVKLYSTIDKYASEIITQHQHGGTAVYDPPKINLTTDVRHCVLTTYNASTQRGIFSVLESQLTSAELGHQHTFTIDTNGNGQTVSIIGSVPNHFHKISNSVVQTQATSAELIDDHTHVLPNITDLIWDEDSQFVVYVNDVAVGNETSSNISVNVTNKTVTLSGIIGAISKTYGVNFEYNGQQYVYQAQESSVYRFMLNMILNFNNTFGTEVNNNPFIFFESDGQTIVGLNDLKTQSLAAEALLQDTGATFMFTPNAANNVVVTLLNYQKTVGFEADKVVIEILGNSEVTGVLKTENILYVNAEKFATGIFEIERIPFISHVGRIDEQFLPFQYPLFSQDGVRFLVTPSVTKTNLDHYHNMILDNTFSGVTQNTYIGNESVYYAEGLTGTDYLIAHLHGVQNSTVTQSGSSGLTAWQNDINNTSNTSSNHSHDLIYPLSGDAKVIYSIREDQYGNIYVGTSDGFIMIPVDDAYLFVINNSQFYEIDNDLLTAFEKAKEDYENATGNPLNIDSATYTAQIAIAENLLVNNGDSYLVVGKSSLSANAEQIMIQKATSFQVPNFKYTERRKFYEIGSDENIVAVELIRVSTGDTVDPNSDIIKAEMEENPSAFELMAVVERYFNTVPITSIDIKEIMRDEKLNNDILVSGGDLVAYNSNIQDSFYQDWSSPITPVNVASIKKISKDGDENVWAASNNGVLVLRAHNQDNIFSITKRPGLSPSINDVLALESDNVFCAADGIFKTENEGKTWSKKLTGNFNQILQDYSLLATSNEGHVHSVSVNLSGTGVLQTSAGHTHTVTNWTVQTSSGHTHTFIMTLFAVSTTTIYRSTNNGETWSTLATLPTGENGKVFAHFGLVYLAKTDGLYVLTNLEWSKIITGTIYSFSVSYDLMSFYVGAVNYLYNTTNGSTFTTTFLFSGFPMPVLRVNDVDTYYGYSYSNRSKSFYLTNITVTNAVVASLVNFGVWYAETGIWDENTPYDIYIDDKLVYSTKSNIDRREIYGWDFTVSPSTGLIDFSGEANIVNEVAVYDSIVEVDDARDFAVGDRILIQTSANNILKLPANPEEDPEGVAEYYQRQTELDNMFYYATITSITTTTISFTPRCTKKIEVPAQIYKLPSLNGGSNIRVNIYESLLSNIGTLTHKDLEDSLSYYSDLRPYHLNESYLSNLLQLTQAIRYVYPNINSNMMQSNFYDFHYSNNPSDSNYIGNYIDLQSGEIYSQINYESPFQPREALSINKILIGTGTFSGNIFVGTEIGLFWAKISDNLESNWFYIFNLPYVVYDLSIFGDQYLFAATSQGIYVTEDLITWERQNQEAIRFPAFSMSLRWIGDDSITIGSHTAAFSNNSLDPQNGLITTTGNLYQNLIPNRSIKITITGDPSSDKNGSYVIQSVSNNQLVVNPPFINVPETLSGVVITVGAWWQKFDGETNTSNPNLTNTLLVGGQNKIAYAPYYGSFIWTESFFANNIEDVNIKKFLPITSGSVLASAVGNNQENIVNHILKCKEIGKNWDSLFMFTEIRGSIQSSTITEYGHSKLTVSYSYPSDLRYSDGEFDKRKISFFLSNSTTSIYDGKVIWNDGLSSTISVFGDEAYNLVNEYGIANISFEIYPPITNDMIETENNDILFGTDLGLYEDYQSIINHIPFEGTVWYVGSPGSITKIDKSGRIKSLQVNPVSQNLIVSISSADFIGANELQGKSLYVTDLSVVEKYEIVSNSSKTIAGEITIEINAQLNSKWLTYVGKRIKLVGDNSVLTVAFDFIVSTAQLNNGTLTVSSDENNNLGTEYAIISNSTSTITLSTAIVPASTLTYDITETLIEGQSFIALDSSGKVDIAVTFNQPVQNNYLADFDFNITSSIGIGNTIDGMTIYSNSGNRILLNDFSSVITNANTSKALIVQPNDAFKASGLIFQPLSSFNNKHTSLESGHYHDVQLVGRIVDGQIKNFNVIQNSSVSFTVENTSGFDSTLVQQDGTLFKNARIRFYNPNKIGVEYFTEVISHTATTITVKILNATNWNFLAYSNIKISETWKWEIDATNYGYTQSIYYNDFIALASKVTLNIALNSTSIFVEDTTGMVVGDKIQIISNASRSEINYIDSIVSGTEITLDTQTSNVYLVSNFVEVKVLRDYFSNTHEHMIRNNQIENAYVESYLERGYSISHSHRNVALIEVVSDIQKTKNDILVAGSSSLIYNSTDDGSSWQQKVNLNNFTEGNIEVDGISSLVINNHKIVAAATNGNVFSEGSGSGSIIPLQQPEVS